MRIKKLTLYNISSYEGENTICFDKFDDNKNIILIGGKNGAGKSSLFQAMKIALYGPMSFNYQGMNSVYITRIRDIINHNAFIKKSVEAYVQLDFSILEERDYVDYSIKRTWSFVNRSLQENVKIFKNNILLSEEEQNYFNEYLSTVLPINLFNLYFFDGEKIDDMFKGVKYKDFIKQSLLTLYSVDVFEVLRKYFDNFVSRTDSEGDLNKAQRDYEQIIERIEVEDLEKNELILQLEKLEEQKNEIEIQLKNVENEFHNSGGLTDAEKSEIATEIKKHEKIKSESNLKLKHFSEDLLPFIICDEHAHKVKMQLNSEKEIQRYNMFKSQLTLDVTKKLLVDSIAESEINELTINEMNSISNVLFDKLISEFKPEGFNLLNEVHKLSSDQQERVMAVANKIIDFNTQTIIKLIKNKSSAQKQTIKFNKKLRDAMKEQDEIAYVKRINTYENDLESLHRQYNDIEIKYNSKLDEISDLENQKYKLKEVLRSKTQQNNMYDLSEKLGNIMDTMVKEVSREKFDLLESKFLEIFKVIMRKENIVDYIKIDDDFRINLYQEKTYRLSEVTTLLNNIGFDKMVDQLGARSITTLFKHFDVVEDNDLKNKLMKHQQEEFLQLHKKIELNQLSKGEKQIFTLSIYWAMIKIANHEIPFIIDTPYARIDTQHRDQISKHFFPTISKQVMILSTDEEINQQYYEVIKPHVGNEYLLINDNEENRTIIEEGYFF